MRAFISGHVDVSKSEFHAHYVPRLDTAIEAGHSFVLGNALGVDTLALAYLQEKLGVDAESRVRIAFFSRYNDVCDIPSAILLDKTFKSYNKRDAYLTQVSDYDIAWVRSETDSRKLYGDKYNASRVSGTQKNLLRRAT